MPGYDGTGPGGIGAMTGGGRGYCVLPVAGNMTSALAQRVGLRRGFVGRGRGMGVGFRMGRGRNLGFGQGYPGNSGVQGLAPTSPYQETLSADQEIDLLQEQAESVRNQLQSIERRLTELKQAGHSA